jgi:hypothetical protein
MPIIAANIIIQGDPKPRISDDTPVRSMIEVRSIGEQKVEKKSRVTDEPLIHHKVSAFHADMLHSDKDK